MLHKDQRVYLFESQSGGLVIPTVDGGSWTNLGRLVVVTDRTGRGWNSYQLRKPGKFITDAKELLKDSTKFDRVFEERYAGYTLAATYSTKNGLEIEDNISIPAQLAIGC